jgi:hypothetical protein
MNPHIDKIVEKDEVLTFTLSGVNVSLANASTAEANRLAKQVKEILLNDKDLQEVGGK